MAMFMNNARLVVLPSAGVFGHYPSVADLGYAGKKQ